MIKPKYLEELIVSPGSEVNLKDFPTDWLNTPEGKELGKNYVNERAAEVLEDNRKQLAEAQELLYASDTHHRTGPRAGC